MYEWDWADHNRWSHETDTPSGASTLLPPSHVSTTALLHWREHCVECAVPDCYVTCPLHVERADLKCARFAYGIVPNPNFSGLFPYGADIRFRRWGKLESRLFAVSATPRQHRGIDGANRFVVSRANRALVRSINAASNVLQPVRLRRKLSGALVSVEDSALVERSRREWTDNFDAFVLECFSVEQEPFLLLLEVVSGNGIRLRRSFGIDPGRNFHIVPWTPSANTIHAASQYIRVYPETSSEPRVIFTWLDLVRFKPGHVPTSVPPERPAEKIKCVAWDLDNTLWSGVLLEDGPENCKLRENVELVVRTLDERGILQTVASKNHHDDAWRLVESLGLGQYFLHPAINWDQKSLNLTRIAKKLNIGIDTFALVDDSSFERAEVESTLPSVRTYPESELLGLLERSEFAVPITQESKRRRQSYVTEVQRQEASTQFGGEYEAFLRSCSIHMRVFVPRSNEEVERCYELITRQ